MQPRQGKPPAMPPTSANTPGLFQKHISPPSHTHPSLPASSSCQPDAALINSCVQRTKLECHQFFGEQASILRQSLSYSATWEKRAAYDEPTREDGLECAFQRMVPVNVKVSGSMRKERTLGPWSLGSGCVTLCRSQMFSGPPCALVCKSKAVALRISISEVGGKLCVLNLSRQSQLWARLGNI